MLSCIYQGHVTHHRFHPVKHQFRYRLYMMYLDLAEIPQLTGPRGPLSQRRFSTGSFLEADHLCDSSQSLEQATRDFVAQQTGTRPSGPIRLLTQLRFFGHYFSPLNLYYCFDHSGEEIESVVAEVSNTPWREQHAYLLWEGNRVDAPAGLRYVHAKSFHVSPFMDMQADYRWLLFKPASKLSVNLMNTHDNEPFFNAQLSMTRRELSRWNLMRMKLRYPFMTAQIVAAIYYQALRLWMKKVPYYPHPDKKEAT